ncbi:hypothetical protein, partial [Halobacterium bonnevillei]
LSPTEDFNKAEVSNSAMGIPTTSTIYESNASDIGVLSDEEIDHIVEYYTRLERTAKYLEYQKKMDTSVDMGLYEERGRRIEGLFNWILRRGSRGLIGKNGSRERTEEAKKQLDKLSKAQKNALAAIEENID